MLRQGITIGDGAVAAAGAIVSKDVAPDFDRGGRFSQVTEETISRIHLKKMLQLGSGPVNWG